MKNNETKKYISNSPEDTKNIAKQIILKYLIENTKENKLEKVINIILNGDLAAGKTKFVEGVLELFNMEKEISSPTFTIVNEYFKDLKIDLSKIDKTQKKEDMYITLNHFDVYRLEDEDEFFESGLKEYIYPDDFNENKKTKKGKKVKINLIEWGLEIENVFPKPFKQINIIKDKENENKRIIEELERF